MARRVLLSGVLIAALLPATAQAALFGRYRLLDRIQSPPQFTLRLLKSGPTCRRVVRTTHRCFTLRQGDSSEFRGEGRLTVRGNHLTFRDDVRGSCPQELGRYAYYHVAGGLRVRLLSDPCPGRRHLFQAGRWRRL